MFTKCSELEYIVMVLRVSLTCRLKWKDVAAHNDIVNLIMMRCCEYLALVMRHSVFRVGLVLMLMLSITARMWVWV